MFLSVPCLSLSVPVCLSGSEAEEVSGGEAGGREEAGRKDREERFKRILRIEGRLVTDSPKCCQLGLCQFLSNFLTR